MKLSERGRLTVDHILETLDHFFFGDVTTAKDPENVCLRLRLQNLFLNVQDSAETKAWTAACFCIRCRLLSRVSFWREHREGVLEMEASDLQQATARRLVDLNLMKALRTHCQGSWQLLPRRRTSKIHKRSSATARVF